MGKGSHCWGSLTIPLNLRFNYCKTYHLLSEACQLGRISVDEFARNPAFNSPVDMVVEIPFLTGKIIIHVRWFVWDV